MAGIPWTAVASTGAVDEESINAQRYAVGDRPLSPTPPPDSSLRFREGAPDAGQDSVIVARYNVTAIASQKPGWTTLELGAVAPVGSRVTAGLCQVARCTGEVIVIAQVEIQNSEARCQSETFTASIDFSKFLYYVKVTVERDSASLHPQAFTLCLL